VERANRTAWHSTLHLTSAYLRRSQAQVAEVGASALVDHALACTKRVTPLKIPHAQGMLWVRAQQGVLATAHWATDARVEGAALMC
jgi:hypothetical protein